MTHPFLSKNTRLLFLYRNEVKRLIPSGFMRWIFAPREKDEDIQLLLFDAVYSGFQYYLSHHEKDWSGGSPKDLPTLLSRIQQNLGRAYQSAFLAEMVWKEYGKTCMNYYLQERQSESKKV